MKSPNRQLLAAAVLLILTAAAPAHSHGQGSTPGQVYSVQYAVPFGEINGNVMLLGDYLVFHDEGEPQSSFVVRRTQIASLTVAGRTINVDTTGPIHDRVGARTQFRFRVDDGTDPGSIVAWRARGGQVATQAITEPLGDTEFVYTVKHDHRFGSCRGQLIIRGDIIAYDSLSDIGHSRRWQLVDVKEMEQKNPYQLSIEAFSGGTYNLEIQGRGMEPADYKLLVERIATARAGS